MESRKEADPWLSPELNRIAPILYIGAHRPHATRLFPDHYADTFRASPIFVQVGEMKFYWTIPSAWLTVPRAAESM